MASLVIYTIDLGGKCYIACFEIRFHREIAAEYFWRHNLVIVSLDNLFPRVFASWNDEAEVELKSFDLDVIDFHYLQQAELLNHFLRKESYFTSECRGLKHLFWEADRLFDV